MPVFRMTSQSIEPLLETTFADAGVYERADLQRLLRANISVVTDDVLVIAEEFGDWDDSRRRIDLLAVDQDANLIVIELKRDTEGAHMELQALRYAAMVSSMTWDRATDACRLPQGEERGTDSNDGKADGVASVASGSAMPLITTALGVPPPSLPSRDWPSDR